MEKWNFIIAISLGMLLSGDNHIPWGFSHSAAPPFPSLPQSLSRPWGMIFLLIILIVPPWLVIIIKIKPFMHNFPGCSAYNPTARPPPLFSTSTIWLTALEIRRKNKKSKEWGSVFWQKMQKAVVAVLIGLRDRHCKQAELSWEIYTEDPYVHWHFIGCLDLLIHYEKCKLYSIEDGEGGTSLARRSSPLMYQIANSLIRRERGSELRLGFNGWDTLRISQNAELQLASSQKKVLKGWLRRWLDFVCEWGGEESCSWNFIKSESLCTKCSFPKSDTFPLHLFTFHSNFFPPADW